MAIWKFCFYALGSFANFEEAIAIAKQSIQDRDVEVDEENTCQVEDKDVLKELEEDGKKADKEEAKATAKQKK